MNRESVAIADVVDINPRLEAGSKPVLDELVSFVPMAAVSAASVSIENPVDRLYNEVSKGFTPFKRGDILIAKITPCFENGKMAHAHDLPRNLGFGSTEFHVLRPKNGLDGRYLFQLLRGSFVRKAGETKMKGAAGQRRVPAEFFASLQIPLPPLAEQKRIAGVLDAADKLRVRRRDALAQLDTLLQSTFLEMFGDPVANPMGWHSGALSQVCRDDSPVTYGILQPGPEVEGGVPYVRPSEIKGGRIDIPSIRRTSPEIAARYKKSVISEGDILITIVGTIGHIATVPAELDGGNITQSSARIRVCPLKANKDYVKHFLKSPFARRQYDRHRLGVAVARLNLHHVRDLQLPLPPLDLQNHFATIVEAVEQQKASQRAHLAELDTLFAALQQRAFNGEL